MLHVNCSALDLQNLLTEESTFNRSKVDSMVPYKMFKREVHAFAIDASVYNAPPTSASVNLFLNNYKIKTEMLNNVVT